MPEHAEFRGPARPRVKFWLAVFLAAFLLWVLNHPMLSIDNHDARIYSILALHWLTPDAYARDPFFLFGSQDSYSLFSPIYGLLIREFGLTIAAGLILLTGGLLWCLAALFMAKGLALSRWTAAIAVLASAVLSINYSPNGQTFVLNEGFATARSIAFPLGALALAACLRGRLLPAGLFAASASLIHPLIGIWALGGVLVWHLSARQITALLGAAILLLLALMLAEVGPFARFDTEWEHLLRTHTWDVFVAEPSQMRWHDYLLMVLALYAASLHAGAAMAGRLYRRALLIAVMALLAAMFASLAWPSRIVIQAQLWRGMWLAAYLMPFALCHLLMLSMAFLRPVDGKWPWASIAFLTVLFMLRDAFLYVLLFWCLSLLFLRHSSGGNYLYRFFQRVQAFTAMPWMPFLATGLLVVALPNFWAELGLLGGVSVLELPIPLQLFGLIFYGGAGFGFALMAWLLVRYGHKSAAAMLLLFLLVFAFGHWDMRNERDRQWEAYAAFGRNDVLTEHIKPGEVVLWDERLPLNAWYELRTAHYASPAQAIGIVFSREKTFELLTRVAHIRAAYAHEHGTIAISQVEPHAFAFRAPAGSGIPLLCQDPVLDWLVVPLSGAPVFPEVAVVPNPYRGPNGALYLYRCADFRKS